jgi:hypothetical protein
MLKKEQNTDPVCATNAEENPEENSLLVSFKNLFQIGGESKRSLENDSNPSQEILEEEQSFKRPPNDQ